jgi:hypothetical protein
MKEKELPYEKKRASGVTKESFESYEKKKSSTDYGTKERNRLLAHIERSDPWEINGTGIRNRYKDPEECRVRKDTKETRENRNVTFPRNALNPRNRN